MDIRPTFIRYILCFFACLLILSGCSYAKKTAHLAPTKTAPPRSSGCFPTNRTSLSSTRAALPSAQGTWPTFHANLNRDGALPTTGGSNLKLVWNYCTGGPVFSSPIVHNGTVYLASTDKTLTALDVRSGKALWQIQADAPFYSTPALQDNVLYAGAVDGSLYAINSSSGIVRWHARTPIAGAKIWSSPAIAGGVVVVGLASALSEKPKIAGQVLALDIRTGKQRWQTSILPQSAPGGGVWSSPAIDATHNIVYVATGDPDDGVQALSLRDGHRIWHWRSVTRDVSDTDVGAGPTLYHDHNGRSYLAVGGKDGYIYSLDATNGHVQWRTQIGKQIYSSPAYSNGTLYAVGVSGRSSTSWSLDATSGRVHWQHAIPVIVYASPAIAGHTLFVAIGNGFGPGDGGIEVINADNGKLLQYANVHSTTSSSPALLTSWLFVGAQNGNLYSFTR
jgi:eukaryotic-like serine/threonine-protein kinase